MRKILARSHSSDSMKSEYELGSSSLSFSVLGQLLSMLASPVIKRSSLSLIGQLDDSAGQEENTEAGLLVQKAVKEDQIQLEVEVLTSKDCR